MTANANLAIWDKLGKTDPDHTKTFKRAGGFSGTAVKPIYTTRKMTEQFGPAGKGWGMGEPTFQVVPASEGQVAVYCTVSLWWVDPADKADEFGPSLHQVYGVGGDMVVVKQSSGLRTDDEAFKKAFTDALGNAMKHLGMSADVHMGLFDDSKYVNEVRQELAAAEQPKQIDGPKSSAQAKREGLWPELKAEVDACGSLEDLERLVHSKPWQDTVKPLPKKWIDELRDYVQEARDAFAPIAVGGVAPNFDHLERQQ